MAYTHDTVQVIFQVVLFIFVQLATDGDGAVQSLGTNLLETKIRTWEKNSKWWTFYPLPHHAKLLLKICLPILFHQHFLML
jgi:hypothetical protein